MIGYRHGVSIAATRADINGGTQNISPTKFFIDTIWHCHTPPQWREQEDLGVTDGGLARITSWAVHKQVDNPWEGG